MPHNFERVGRRMPPSGTFFELNKKGKLVAVPTAPLTPEFSGCDPAERTGDDERPPPPWCIRGTYEEATKKA